MQKVISYNGATITVKRGNVETRLDGLYLYSQLGVDKDTPNRVVLKYSNFVRFLTQCHVEGHVGFDEPSLDADEAVLQAGYQAFMNADEALFDLLVDALNDVDHEHQPEELRLDTPKKS